MGIKRCAFCHNEGVTGEHLWDNWLNEELPKRTRFNAKKRLSIDSAPIEFVLVGLNEKLLVVCEKCNSGWMSDLTAKVKARFRPTILKHAPISLELTDATLLACFTLMKAVVKDYCYGIEPFFTKAIRKRLRVSLTVPPLAKMWFAAFQGSSRYSFHSNFHIVSTSEPGPLDGMEFFSYTYIQGNLVVQLLAPRWKEVRDWNKPLVTLKPHDFWRSAAIQFWPYTGAVHWPPEKYLGDATIEQFVYRFKNRIEVPI